MIKLEALAEVTMFWIIAGGVSQGRATSAIRRDIVPLTALLDGKLEKDDEVGKEE